MTPEELDHLLATDDPLSEGAFPEELRAQWREERERVRQHCVKLFSASPLYQARAAKDPQYWNNFYVGLVKP